MCDTYINRANGVEEVNYVIPELESITKNTFGVILYQETVMALAVQLAGFTKEESNHLRKIIGKKKRDKIQEQLDWLKYGIHNKEHDIDGIMKKCGATEEQVDEILDMLKRMAAYAFNKSHAVCYGMNSAKSAYLKTYYPVEYMSALISSTIISSDQSEDENKNKVLKYYNHSKELGIEFLPIDVNHSAFHFIPENGKIRTGMGIIKGMNKSSIYIWKEREDHGKYKSLEDFVKRIPSSYLGKASILGLCFTGALDSLCNNKSRLEILQDILTLTNRKNTAEELVNEIKDENKKSLCETIFEKYKKYIKNEDILKKLVMYYLEKNFSSIMLEPNPLFKKESLEWKYYGPNQKFTDIVIIKSIKHFKSKKGTNCHFMIVENKYGNEEVSVWDDKYEDSGNKLQEGNILEMEIKVGLYKGNKTYNYNSSKYYREN